MNGIHRWLCRSENWRRRLNDELIPWALRDTDLGDHLLELGPGPGLTTEVLRRRFDRLTSIEIDPQAAASLRLRFNGGNVEIVEGDATAMPFSDKTFTGAVSFTMLHHVPGAELQDRLFRETFRVLKPAATFVATDSRINWMMRLIHIGDTMVIVDPDTVQQRLERAGFVDVFVQVTARIFQFRARRPPSPA